MKCYKSTLGYLMYNEEDGEKVVIHDEINKFISILIIFIFPTVYCIVSYVNLSPGPQWVLESSQCLGRINYIKAFIQ